MVSSWCPLTRAGARTSGGSERGLVAAGRGTAPTAATAGVAAAGGSAGRPGVVGRGTAAEAAPATGSAAGLGDLGRGVPEDGTDVIDVALDRGALAALAGLVLAHLEAAGDDDAHALGQGLGDVLGVLAPDRAAEEDG